MKIALISYEYPPDTSDGGIATYVQQASRMLQKRDHALEDPERRHPLQADAIAAPSQAIAETVARLWKLDTRKVHLFPSPYLPAPELLKIPFRTETRRVVFMGRLEARKGVLDLAKAIPLVLKQYPEAKFRFVGRSGQSPNPKQTLRQYLEANLSACRPAVEFTGGVPLDQVPSMLSDADIGAIPSLWDNFPSVCLEAMAAGRGVIASKAGGRAEMIDSDAVGRLVEPKHPQDIAQAAIELLQNPSLRMRLGTAARARVLQEYSLERVAAQQEQTYRQAIAAKHKARFA
jgi:glycogen synthase